MVLALIRNCFFRRKLITISSIWPRTLKTSIISSNKDRYIVGKQHGLSPTDLRGKLIDESDETLLNIDMLAVATTTFTDKDSHSLPGHNINPLFPDENTSELMFDGLRYRDLVYVTIICTYNNTKFWVNKANGERIVYTAPTAHGFMNAAKRTNVAAQATGTALGQMLRNKNIRNVRVRIDGFNNGRIAAVTGLVVAGINVISISDITIVHWDWPQRAKKRKRRN